jgi:hypothetical protein
MAEGRRTELQQRLAAKDRERTEAELWSLRRARALDDLGQEGDRLEQRWVHDFLRTREELGAQRIAGQATNPHFGGRERTARSAASTRNSANGSGSARRRRAGSSRPSGSFQNFAANLVANSGLPVQLSAPEST